MEIDRSALVQGVRTLLGPIASLMLKCGLTWREFAEIAKTVFVQAASRDYGIRGRPTNLSRVAILTGIGRRDVARIRGALASEPAPLPNQTTDATRLLSGWHQDSEFTGADGKPLDLPPSGPGASFEELARRYAIDVPAVTMLKELRRVGAVSELPGGRLRATRRYYQPAPLDAQWILNAGSVLADLGANVNHNLGRSADAQSWFLGRAADERIDPRALGEFRAFVEAQGQQFLERMDEWLARHRLGDADGAGIRLGVGLFMINRDNST